MDVSAERAKNSARSFYMAYGRLQEPRERADGSYQALLVPGVTCLAFAVELGLKALALGKGATLHGHDLKKLFDGLPIDVRKCVSEILGMDAQEFEHRLVEHARTFPDFRYIHEKSEHVGANVEFLSRLYHAIEALF